MIENILILDTETTGLSPSNGDLIIEIAAVLFNIKHKSILQCYSTLYPCETNPVEHINRIKPELTKMPYSLLYVDNMLMGMADNARAIVAHNAQFDKKFVALLECGNYFVNQKWICTKSNFTWPVPLPRLRLEDICNGMKVPYINAHRALADCLLLAQCFEQVEDLEERINRC